MSSGLPSRFKGICWVKAARCSSGKERVISVSIKPGAMVFTVTFLPPISRAKDLLKPIIPALEAA